MLELGDPEKALKDFQAVVTAQSGNAEALFGLGKALVALGHADAAITPLTRAIEADPNNAEAFRLRGTAYAGIYKNKQAIDDLQQAHLLERGRSRSILHARHGVPAK